MRWAFTLLCQSLAFLPMLGGEVVEDFKSNPLDRGWRQVGDPTLFEWKPNDGGLHVTWDSERPNSYYRLPLGTVLNRYDSFSLRFVLRLEDVAAGVLPQKPSTFALAVGLQNQVQADASGFVRGVGTKSPNLVEFNFFPDTGFGSTLWPALWSTNSTLAYTGAADYALADFPTGVPVDVRMTFDAAQQTLSTQVGVNGTALTKFEPIRLPASFRDFRVDAFAISSYSSAGQDPRFAGSLLAHGTIELVELQLPPSALGRIERVEIGNQPAVRFLSRSHWVYALESSPDLMTWAAQGPWTSGTDNPLVLIDSLPADRSRFYRVSARKQD